MIRSILKGNNMKNWKIFLSVVTLLVIGGIMTKSFLTSSAKKQEQGHCTQ